MKVGDKLYSFRKRTEHLKDKDNSHHFQTMVVYSPFEVTIEKVGSKYCHVREELGICTKPYKINKETLKEVSPYGDGCRFFETKKQCEDWVWMKQHQNGLYRKVTSVQDPNILKKIAELVGYEHDCNSN